MDELRALRGQLGRILAWEDAHVAFDAAVEGIPVELRDRRPDGLPYSAWELVEHLRRTQYDILDFCRNPSYQERSWPADYWPPPDSTPDPEAWEHAVAAYRADRAALQEIATGADLFARIPHGTGQTILRELLLVADHNAYHVGQLVAVRRLLGIWGT
ncbi:MAG TPA: DinB family protein [Longimicrobiales bacterium]|nr:DinB family protein [Longimicrobiales bacterium]